MKKKIIFIGSYAPSLTNFRLDLMKAFIARGFEVGAIAPDDSEVASELKKENIHFIPITMQRNGLNPFADLKLIKTLADILRKECPDAIFAYTIKPVIYGSIAAKLAKVPEIYSMITGAGYTFLNRDLKSKIIGGIARRLFGFGLKFNKRVFFQNEDNLTLFQENNIIPFSKPVTVVNGSGVDCDKFVPTTYPENISFLMICRFLYDKGIMEYIDAAKKIKARYPHVKFRLVGWIDTNPNSISEKMLTEWIEEGTIEYLGQLKDVRPAIANTSVYVLPSYYEGTPRTVLEAMAMARPIITTDVPGCRGTVIHQKTGMLVPVKNSDALYEAMEYFILHPAQISRMGEASRKLALDKYDVNKVNSSILQAMQAGIG